MTRDQALQMLRADLLDACQQLSLERLIVARNLVRCMVEEQEAERSRQRVSGVVRTANAGPSVAKAAADTPVEPIRARSRGASHSGG